MEKRKEGERVCVLAHVKTGGWVGARKISPYPELFRRKSIVTVGIEYGPNGRPSQTFTDGIVSTVSIVSAISIGTAGPA
jgi:hypothetical protein